MAKKINETELNDAVLVETPEIISKLMAEPAAPKRSRKAKMKDGAAKLAEEELLPDYAALGIPETEVALYEALRLRFKELGRRSTAQVFECGQVVAELQRLAPDQESFAKASKKVLGLSRRGAENYANVFNRLADKRERLVAVGMAASALYELATAEPEQVEAVLGAFEAGQELTVAQVKVMLGKTSDPSVSPEDGGAGGLRARIAEKTAIGVAALMDNAAALLEALLIALEPYRQDKRIVVKETQRPFIHPTRLIQQQLEWLTWIAVPAPEGFAERAIHHHPVVKGDRYAELHATLAKLGDYEGWPPAAQVGSWLADTVVPQLAWLLGDRARKAFAVVDKMAAAAEAERIKAEEAKAREKALAKKLREKAKLDKLKADRRAHREAKALAKLAETKDEQAQGSDDTGTAPSAEA